MVQFIQKSFNHSYIFPKLFDFIVWSTHFECQWGPTTFHCMDISQNIL